MVKVEMSLADWRELIHPAQITTIGNQSVTEPIKDSKEAVLIRNIRDIIDEFTTYNDNQKAERFNMIKRLLK